MKTELAKSCNELESSHLEQLSSVGVDLTQYLVNQQDVVPDEVVQVVHCAPGAEPTHHTPV